VVTIVLSHNEADSDIFESRPGESAESDLSNSVTLGEQQACGEGVTLELTPEVDLTELPTATATLWTPSATPTPTEMTGTPTVEVSHTPTPSPTSTLDVSETPTATNSPTATKTKTLEPTATKPPTPTLTETKEATVTPASTQPPQPSPTDGHTETPQATPTPGETEPPTNVPTPNPSATSTPSVESLRKLEKDGSFDYKNLSDGSAMVDPSYEESASPLLTTGSMLIGAMLLGTLVSRLKGANSRMANLFKIQNNK
jgi:hypothetical protein